MTFATRTTRFSLLFLTISSLALAQGLSPSAPLKEYIRFGGQIVAIENVTAAGCVTNLTGAGSGGITPRIDLSWSALTGASSYQVLRGTTSGGPYTALGTSTLTAYGDTDGLIVGASYFYVLQPLNIGGAEICQSNEKEITLATPPPGRH